MDTRSTICSTNLPLRMDKCHPYTNYFLYRTTSQEETKALPPMCLHACYSEVLLYFENIFSGVRLLLNSYTVEPPNKGHFGDNINSAVLSLYRGCPYFGGSKCIRTIGKQIFGILNCVLCIERSIILCPYLRGSTIGGSTVCINQMAPKRHKSLSWSNKTE